MKYYDVSNLNELPEIKKGYRYLDFLGGTKQFRCYVVSKDLPRCLFMEKHREELDEILLPIYIDEDICISQDASYALPGFYIISFRKHYKNITEITPELYLKINYWVYQIRLAMKELLKIRYANIYYEEKSSNSANVHYWVMPIVDEIDVPKLHYINLKDYLEKFKLEENREKIKEYNKLMKKYIDDMKISDKVNIMIEGKIKK